MLTTKSPKDPAIIRQVLSGDRVPFDVLVQRYLPSVYAVAFARVGNHADAEDVAQETFLRAFKKIDSLREPRKVEGWLTTIARNVANTLLSKRIREREAAGDVVEAPQPELSDAARNEVNELLHRHVENLDESHREVLMLHYFAGNYFAGKSAREIASALGISRMAALKRLQRAREELSRELLPELEGTLQPRKSYSEQGKKISIAVAAATVAWETAGASALAGGGLGGLNIGLPGAATGFVGLGIAVLVFMVTMGKEDTASQPEPEMAARIDVVPDLLPSFEEPEPAEAPEELVEEVEVPASEVEIVGAVEPEGSVYSINEGLWILSMWYGDEQSIKVDFPTPIRFRLQGRSLYIESEDESGTIEPFGHGTILGTHVELFGMLDLSATDRTPIAKGEFNTSFTRATLTGLLPVEVTSTSEPLSLTLAFRKMDEEDTNRLASIEELKEEVSQLFAAIQKFRDDTGAFPMTLAELVPDYIDSLDAIRNTKDRQIAYAPELFSKVGDLMSESDIIGPTAGLYQDLEIPDRYMEWEWALEDRWDGRFMAMGKPGLSVSHSGLNVRITANRSGRIQEAPLNVVSSGEELSEVMLEAQRMARNASCKNNLKQLALVIVMFQHEHEGSMTPPGWHSVYPEYLGDVAILTCPGGEAHTLGYEIVFPATMAEYFDDLAAELDGITTGEVVARQQSEMRTPLVIETGECNELGGRNVAFLDGHVEFVRHEDWDAVVGPYLEFR